MKLLSGEEEQHRPGRSSIVLLIYEILDSLFARNGGKNIFT